MKCYITIILGLLAGCAPAGNVPAIPNDRPPTASELVEASIGVECVLPPNAPGLWAEWVGYATAHLGGPLVSQADLPATIAFEAGWENLDPSCLTDGTGTWTYDEATGELYAFFDLDDGTTNFELTGTLNYTFIRVPIEPEAAGRYRIETVLEAVGVWNVLPGDDCDADDFTAGTTGPFVGQDGSVAASAATGDDEVGTTVRLTVVNLETGDVAQEVVGLQDFLTGRIKVRTGQ